jgi:hypothetical protein
LGAPLQESLFLLEAPQSCGPVSIKDVLQHRLTQLSLLQCGQKFCGCVYEGFGSCCVQWNCSQYYGIVYFFPFLKLRLCLRGGHVPGDGLAIHPKRRSGFGLGKYDRFVSFSDTRLVDPINWLPHHLLE